MGIARSTSSQASAKGDSSAADRQRLCESHKTNGHRAPEAVQDLAFDAVADARTQLTGPRPPLETVTTGTLWSLARQPVTRHDDPDRTPLDPNHNTE